VKRSDQDLGGNIDPAGCEPDARSIRPLSTLFLNLLQASLGAGDGPKKVVKPDAGLGVASGEDLDSVPVLESDSEVDSDMDNDTLQAESESTLRPRPFY